MIVMNCFNTKCRSSLSLLTNLYEKADDIVFEELNRNLFFLKKSTERSVRKF